MHDRTESEVARRVDVTGLDPTAGGGDETVCRDRLWPQLLIWTIPEREPACDRTALLRCQRRGRQLPVLLKPSHDLAIGRIDKTMAQAQPVVDAQRRALDMKTGTGAKFACEAGIDPAGNVGAARHIDEAKFVREVGIRLLQPIEVIGDREVLGHVALPGRHRATIGFGPIRHDAISITLPLPMSTVQELFLAHGPWGWRADAVVAADMAAACSVAASVATLSTKCVAR